MVELFAGKILHVIILDILIKSEMDGQNGAEAMTFTDLIQNRMTESVAYHFHLSTGTA